MTDFKSPAAPQWAPRVSKEKITRIYEDDANGLHDAALLDDVAFILLMRCQSMLMAEEARNGRASCPVCGKIIEHAGKKGTILDCPYCSWQGSWDAYRASMNGMHLIAPGILPFCAEYANQITLDLSPKKKMYWINWLIHRVHWEGTALPGQPGAVCLIKGRSSDVNEYLAKLTAGTHHESHTPLDSLWSEEKKAQILKWRKASDKRRVKRDNDD